MVRRSLYSRAVAGWGNGGPSSSAVPSFINSGHCTCLLFCPPKLLLSSKPKAIPREGRCNGNASFCLPTQRPQAPPTRKPPLSSLARFPGPESRFCQNATLQIFSSPPQHKSTLCPAVLARVWIIFKLGHTIPTTFPGTPQPNRWQRSGTLGCAVCVLLPTV